MPDWIRHPVFFNELVHGFRRDDAWIPPAQGRGKLFVALRLHGMTKGVINFLRQEP